MVPFTFRSMAMRLFSLGFPGEARRQGATDQGDFHHPAVAVGTRLRVRGSDPITPEKRLLFVAVDDSCWKPTRPKRRLKRRQVAAPPAFPRGRAELGEAPGADRRAHARHQLLVIRQ